jgi:hypothetical protein
LAGFFGGNRHSWHQKQSIVLPTFVQVLLRASMAVSAAMSSSLRIFCCATRQLTYASLPGVAP